MRSNYNAVRFSLCLVLLVLVAGVGLVVLASPAAVRAQDPTPVPPTPTPRPTPTPWPPAQPMITSIDVHHRYICIEWRVGNESPPRMPVNKFHVSIAKTTDPFPTPHGTAATFYCFSSLEPETSYKIRVVALDDRDVASIADNRLVMTEPDNLILGRRYRCPVPAGYVPDDLSGNFYTNEQTVLQVLSKVINDDDTVTFEVAWSSVRAAEWYELRIIRDGQISYNLGISGDHLQVEYANIPFSAESFEIQARGAIYLCEGFNPRILELDNGDEVILWDGYAYSPWSAKVPIGINLIERPEGEGKALGDRGGPTVIEGIPQLAEVIAEFMGEEPGSIGVWALFIWLGFSMGVAGLLGAAVGAVSEGWLKPGPIFVGCGAFTLLWTIGGPLLAGIPIAMALMPLALVLLLVIWMIRSQKLAI